MIVSFPRAVRSLLYLARPAYQRFIVAASINFAISYGFYLFFLLWMGPKIAYLIAYTAGLITGNCLHIRFTHQKSLTAANFGIQAGVQIGIGGVATIANGWASQFSDPRLSGFAVIVIFGVLSFMISRLLLR